MLEAQGVDPILFLVVPRVVAFAVSAFCLVMVFLTTALLVGYFAGHAVGAVKLSLYQFLDNLLRAMGPREYVLRGGGEGRRQAHGARLRAGGGGDLCRKRRDQHGVVGDE